jgi:Sulfotransferase family
MSLYDGTFALFVNSLEFLEDRAIVEPQYAWHDFNINILNFLDSVPPGQQMRVRGEDMMSDPPTYLRQICRWLGLRDDVDAIDQMMHPERSPFACFGPLDALFGNDPNFLSGPTFRPHKVKMPALDKPVPWREDGQGLKPAVVALARELGY